MAELVYHGKAATEYVDKALDNVAHVSSDVTWTNAEVMEMLDDLRSILITGDVTPGTLGDVEIGRQGNG